jgi:hypothetical protein
MTKKEIKENWYSSFYLPKAFLEAIKREANHDTVTVPITIISLIFIQMCACTSHSNLPF